MDLFAFFHTVLHSVWLLPVLVLMIAVDGPVPMLPSETLLMSAAAAAFGAHSTWAVAGLFFAALVGSVLGDLAVFGLGRSSNKILPRAADGDSGIASWVRANIFRRPVVALVGARFVPGGRLVSTAAAGRLGLPVRHFLLGSVLSSAVWAVYMLVIGLALGPMTGGNPLLCVLAGGVMAVLTAGIFAVGARVRAAVHRRRAVVVPHGKRSGTPALASR
ncbi:membrane protein DedA with SNARE-associated domain [Pseudonocardia sediminis]|uniref:Membrane protein DedA with SNARE-associated domain n=1 Tax=Pseudonocardia sediminis TaxID=1397368 RepID=A0A4Q7V4S4_PSEST|nr:VTT domain-containing protein [Pseudonocardia sediminis]RZT87753.1 membrane protein DedA with SNARE-associated domain [Pseudonocardia sediminis]